jgi:hypothetical protein
MIYKYSTLPSVVLGFHSCDKETGLKVINGEEHLKPSTNDYDWLGQEQKDELKHLLSLEP